MVGDLTGKKTCFNYNGSSVVDYVIISSRILNYVNYFIVNDLEPHLSEHCYLSFALMLKHKKRCSGKRSDEITLSEFKKLVWDDNAKFELCRLLESIETKNRLNIVLNNNNVDAMTELFAQNLIDVCKQAGLRFNNTKRKHIEKPWFDEQCNIEKENLQSLGRHISRNPKVEELRSSLHKKKNGFQTSM